MNKGQEYYLNDGKLDLSLLNEDISKESINKPSTLLEDIEAIKVNNEDISSTLEEVALMFEEK